MSFAWLVTGFFQSHRSVAWRGFCMPPTTIPDDAAVAHKPGTSVRHVPNGAVCENVAIAPQVHCARLASASKVPWECRERARSRQGLTDEPTSPNRVCWAK